MNVSRIPARRGGDSLRVLTYNIYNTEGDWDRRRPILADGLRELKPDIIGFQETSLTDEIDQVRQLLGESWHILHSEKRKPGEIGVSIASRLPLHFVGELDLHVTKRTDAFPCTALIAEVHVPEPIGRVLVVNHFPDYQVHHERERELQTVLVARRVEELVAENDAHVILLGDLDAEPDSATLRFLTGRQSLEGLSVCYRNAWESAHAGERGETFTPRNALMAAKNWDWPFRQIDHILVRCGRRSQPTLNIPACELAFDEAIDGVWGSDHIAVAADLEVPASQ
jgi:endonuclease/exonuclease/phosphatase family metal-dependent hydrolase